MIVDIRGVVCVAITLVATLVMINDIMQCTVSVQSYFKSHNFFSYVSVHSFMCIIFVLLHYMDGL